MVLVFHLYELDLSESESDSFVHLIKFDLQDNFAFAIEGAICILGVDCALFRYATWWR